MAKSVKCIMKNLIVALSCLLLLTPLPVLAEQSVSFGGGIGKGHTYSGHEGLEDGYSSKGSYQKYLHLTKYFKLGFGVTLQDYLFELKHNGDGKGNDYKRTTEYAFTTTADSKVYFDYFNWVKPFVGMSGGVEFSTDETVLPVYVIRFGTDVKVYKNWYLELMSSHQYSNERRFGIETLSVKYYF